MKRSIVDWVDSVGVVALNNGKRDAAILTECIVRSSMGCKAADMIRGEMKEKATIEIPRNFFESSRRVTKNRH